MTYIPDPIEQMESRIERMADEYELGVCMGCGKKVDYELMCVSPTGDGPAVCAECCPEAHGISSPNTPIRDGEDRASHKPST